MRQFILTKLKQFEITDKWIDKGIGECPCCHKGKIKEGDKSFFCSEYKAGCKFSVWKNIAGAKISVSDIQLLIAVIITFMSYMFCFAIILIIMIIKNQTAKTVLLTTGIILFIIGLVIKKTFIKFPENESLLKKIFSQKKN